MNVIDEPFGGVAHDKEIMLGLFRRYEVAKGAHYMSNKLARMEKQKLVFSARHGFYATTKEVADKFMLNDGNDPGPGITH